MRAWTCGDSHASKVENATVCWWGVDIRSQSWVLGVSPEHPERWTCHLRRWGRCWGLFWWEDEPRIDIASSSLSAVKPPFDVRMVMEVTLPPGLIVEYFKDECSVCCPTRLTLFTANTLQGIFLLSCYVLKDMEDSSQWDVICDFSGLEFTHEFLPFDKM